ncbi:transmembrane and ubiquitin-like domain-containing protein 2 [Xiphias gladius]|uniref:transmembrane and ubiquitin-like domain-containing protein 2 n=1 Tax=Xiphias gladius TaxID=8245 RepID=UPI001A98C647|nr:transmembrane and ubiquitin-like domain-containing protein 2 [Xiphias gladius]XP_040015606.1 transmembrane and ubiquitin-like domain-containing protein 2 [Xiphias gladius]XP_040015616.1 transmembrane and ubiquitin-like domain-containing protein 2 [Xiphias gladius]XP_040015624.1 transmembrane and ubiquitin-like domain-containing protein 2 [Xiphias gladius]XP_040015633.1 transmembrane and ubiquitin-like domain-containing protein 2 [Xiphias gladius]
MAVCALTMLDGMEEEVTAAGGVLLLVLALVLAWLSTHVADRGDHILGTILTVGAHASLIGLGGHDSYSGGSPRADTPEQQTPPPSQENKPDDGEPGTERGEGEGAEGVRTDLLLDIQSKQPQAGGLHTSDEEEDEVDEEEEEEQLEAEDKKVIKSIPVLSNAISLTSTATTTTSISVRLKFLNDTEELAVLEPQDTVGELKSKYFSGREHQIKLIYQGQLLQDPKKTLLSLNITHNSVIHCHISQALHEASPEEGAQSVAGAGVGSGVSGGFRAASMAISTGSLVVPVFVVILAVVWYFRINYRQFFTAPATISLVGVTVFFSFLIFGMHSR